MKIRLLEILDSIVNDYSNAQKHFSTVKKQKIKQSKTNKTKQKKKKKKKKRQAN